MDTPLPTAAQTNADLAAEFEKEFVAGLESEDDVAARELLTSGRSIYYVEDDTPPGLVIKEHPDGRRQFVRHVRGNDQVIRDL